MDLRLVVVEDDTRYRRSLEALLGNSPGVALAASFSDAKRALVWIEAQDQERPPFEVVVMDIELPGMSGIQAAARVRARFPAATVVMLTVFEEPGTILQAICAGANGYLLKRTSARELLAQLRSIASGGAPMTAGVARTVLELLRRGGGDARGAPGRLDLTEREQDVLRCLVGMDLAPGFSRPSAEACAESCGVDMACHSWTFASDAGLCWLKSGVPAASACATCTSGVIDRALELNTNRGGSDIRTESALSARECSKRCTLDSACLAFTFIGGTTGNCFIKGAVPEPSFSAGTTSGVKRGVSARTVRFGSDIANFATPVLSPYVCQAACADNASCQAWTYTLPTPTGTQGHCWLKNGVPAPFADNGSVSGVRGLEFLP